MKKSLHDMLDGMTAAELDAIEIPSAQLDDGAAERIRALAAEKAGLTGRKKRITARRLMLAAAFAILLTAALVGGFVADAAEYHRAMEFFDLNSFSTEGLDRNDIKRVYRDITSENVTYDMSIEVLEQSGGAAPLTVEGLDIIIMNYANNQFIYERSQQGRPLYAEGVFYYYNSLGAGEHWGIAKYIDGEKQWTADGIDDFYINNHLLLDDDRLFVYGMYSAADSSDKNTVAVMIDDNNGQLLWELGSGGGVPERIHTAVRDDNRDIVIAGTDTASLTVSTLDPSDGSVIRTVSFETYRSPIIRDVTAMGDGYLLAVNAYDRDKKEPRDVLWIVSGDGRLTGELSCSDDDRRYEVGDIRWHDGWVFVSATARPEDPQLYSGIGAWQDEGDGAAGSEHFTEEWRDRAREEFSAVLFVIDPDSGEVVQFCNVGGAFGGELGADESGSLTWNVERILTCGYAPKTYRYDIYGHTRRYIYTFDSESDTLRQERTDLIGKYVK